MFQNIGTGPGSWSVMVVRIATGMMYWPRLAYIGYSDARTWMAIASSLRSASAVAREKASRSF